MLQKQLAVSPEAYLHAERLAESKHEYLDGEIFAIVGASREHNQIASNVVRVLGNQLLDEPCSVFASDMKVKIEAVNKFCYPDIVVVCEQADFADAENDVLLNPLVIMEILSDSTEAYDRGDKFVHHQQLSSLLDYILIAQSTQRVEKFSRRDDNSWVYSHLQQQEAILPLESINCRLPLAEIYRKVPIAIS